MVCLRTLTGGAGEARGGGLRYVHVATQPWSMDRAVLRRVLSGIAGAEGPVLVHCRRGADRTAAVIAAYRVRCEAWDCRAAIREMTSPSRGYWSRWANLVALIESL